MAVLAWRFSGTQPSHRRESRWMAVMFTLFAARLLLVTLVLLPESQFGTATLPQLLGVALVQVVQVVAAGVIAIAVAVSYEKTAVLAQTAQLYEAEMAVQRGQRLAMLGRMAAGIAHDFNNVLMVIGSRVETAETELGSPDDARAELREAAAALKQAGNLTTRLMAFAKPKEARTAAVPSNVDAVVRGCSPLLTRAAGTERTLRIELSLDGVATRLDQTEIEQLVLNLVVNARDATQEGGTITLRTALELVGRPRRVYDGTLPSGRYVRLSVEDTGTGIPDDVLPHILDPFFTTRRETGGSGIGLATVYQIVVAAGGHLDIKSSLGHGSCFDLFLPAAD
jgi:signal transduction histidine kinase